MLRLSSECADVAARMGSVQLRTAVAPFAFLCHVRPLLAQAAATLSLSLVDAVVWSWIEAAGCDHLDDRARAVKCLQLLLYM